MSNPKGKPLLLKFPTQEMRDRFEAEAHRRKMKFAEWIRDCCAEALKKNGRERKAK